MRQAWVLYIERERGEVIDKRRIYICREVNLWIFKQAWVMYIERGNYTDDSYICTCREIHLWILNARLGLGKGVC